MTGIMMSGHMIFQPAAAQTHDTVGLSQNVTGGNGAEQDQ